MPNNPEKKQDFSTYGQESYDLADKKEKKEINEGEVILNIMEDNEQSSTPITVDSQKSLQINSTGNPFLDFYNRINLALIKKSSVNGEVKGTFFHLLGVMINAGIPMVKSLTSLIRQQDKSPRMKLIIQDLADSIVGGMSLSKSMMQHPDVFTEQELGMIQSGEASGQISKVLDTLANDSEKANMIKRKVKSALMYPVVIFTLLVAVVIVMLVYVIPQLTDLFEGAGSELPLITRIVVGMSDFLINKKLFLIGILTILFATFYFMRKTEQGRYYIDKFKINIPIFGPLLRKSYLSRFARSLSNLLDSSVSILKTMEITAKSIGNEVYKRRLFLAMEDIRQGIPLAENLNESDLFPPMFVSMIEVGEKTAQLDTIMGQIADFYEEEVDTTVNGLSKIIEPIMLVIIGLTVGAIVSAIMLPIMKLSDLASSI